MTEPIDELSLARIGREIAQRGWHFETLADSETAPPATYTVGLGESFGNPELILIGLPPELARTVLTKMAEQIRDGQAYVPGRRYSGILDKFDVLIGAVHATQAERRLPLAAAWYATRPEPQPLRAIQIFFPDRAGHFPGDPASDLQAASIQPSLEHEAPGVEAAPKIDRRDFN